MEKAKDYSYTPRFLINSLRLRERSLRPLNIWPTLWPGRSHIILSLTLVHRRLDNAYRAPFGNRRNCQLMTKLDDDGNIKQASTGNRRHSKLNRKIRTCQLKVLRLSKVHDSSDNQSSRCRCGTHCCMSDLITTEKRQDSMQSTVR